MRNPGQRGCRAQNLECNFRFSAFCLILIFAVAKRKPARFSAAKAVKANARERVGQPKPSRVLPGAPPTGRKAKYKPKVEDIIREEQ
jgi:hypothetical protein